ncbi:RluA family pseudouridine synthase [Pontibacillus yanchengensis]|uniref:Pseudouridine synthase n=1 Tax=Pontibacillus yanchengensis Y32 TaxID=1385514 RepID=A0A0A2TEW1_9BACI|nr:RluA family pseudouridine synthase [Pontibacillus yanchengensis]KGP74342.1 pseudouridine synthase [Pontibacillus yanchengensis Y32]
MKWTITKQQEGMLVRNYLHSVRAFSRSMVKVVKFEGAILLNDDPVSVKAKLAEGDVLELHFPPEERGPHLHPVDRPIVILYEDEDVLVLNKPAGLATIPSIHHLEDTLSNRIIAYYNKENISYTVHIVTRLDVDTSGIVLIAKHRLAHSILSSTQEKGQIRRTYKAIVSGRIADSNGTIAAPIGRNYDSLIERQVTPDGREAITHYQVEVETPDYTLLDVRLETGRTHQIRVHFSYLGHPLLGDHLYGGERSLIDRQALHCTSLVFPHPMSGEEIVVNAEMPEDMVRLITHEKS